MRTILIACVTIFGVMQVPAKADFCDPTQILIQNKSFSYNNEYLKLSVLDQIDKEHFDEAKTQIGTGGSAIIYGIPMSAYGNYDDYRSALDKEKSLYKFGLDQRAMSLYVQQSMPDQAYAAYVRCLDNMSTDGVVMWLGNTGAFSKKILLNVRWLGGVGGKPGTLENDILLDGVTISADLREKSRVHGATKKPSHWC